MFAADFLPESVKANGADVLWLAGLVGAIGVLVSAPFIRRPMRWIWARLVSEPLGRWATLSVHAAVRPLIDESRAQSKAQHDDQNTRLDGIEGRIGTMEGRLDTGSQTMSALLDIASGIDGRVADLDAWRSRWEGLTPDVDDAQGVLNKWAVIDERLARLESDEREDPT